VAEGCHVAWRGFHLTTADNGGDTDVLAGEIQ
jgi:hypothetical protein